MDGALIDRSHDEPFGLFDRWLREAGETELNDPNAMCLSTATAGAAPSSRMVLLKGHGPDGFVFYTNLDSRKGGELRDNPRVSLLLHWKTRRRQVRIEGAAGPVPDAEADRYFASRDRVSRLGAHASDQSRPLDRRETLLERVDALDRRYPGDDIPRPDRWSGFRVVPARIEFWQDMPHRLHDRLSFARVPGGRGWTATRLYP